MLIIAPTLSLLGWSKAWLVLLNHTLLRSKRLHWTFQIFQCLQYRQGVEVLLWRRSKQNWTCCFWRLWSSFGVSNTVALQWHDWSESLATPIQRCQRSYRRLGVQFPLGAFLCAWSPCTVLHMQLARLNPERLFLTISNWGWGQRVFTALWMK